MATRRVLILTQQALSIGASNANANDAARDLKSPAFTGAPVVGEADAQKHEGLNMTQEVTAEMVEYAQRMLEWMENPETKTILFYRDGEGWRASGRTIDYPTALTASHTEAAELKARVEALTQRVGNLEGLLGQALPYVTKCADMDLADAVACMMIIEHELRNRSTPA